jgi:hypothetical protein
MGARRVGEGVWHVGPGAMRRPTSAVVARATRAVGGSVGRHGGEVAQVQRDCWSGRGPAVWCGC